MKNHTHTILKKFGKIIKVAVPKHLFHSCSVFCNKGAVGLYMVDEQELSSVDALLHTVCGPDIWNSLPANTRLTDSRRPTAFRRALMSHLFNIAFI